MHLPGVWMFGSQAEPWNVTVDVDMVVPPDLCCNGNGVGSSGRNYIKGLNRRT